MRIFILAVLALILTASWQPAQAEEVCLDGNTATEIKDLVVPYDNGGSDTFDVSFRYETGNSVYGQDLTGFPFPPTDGRAEEKAGATMLAINRALDPTTASSAGVASQDIYYIGVEEEQEGEAGLIAFIGGEYVGSSIWERCKTGCALGAGIVKADVQRSWADLTSPDGSGCDGGPPPGPGFSIIPAITGSWKDEARDGEGYNIEIIGTAGNYTLLVYFFTYDAGKQMWLVGTGPVVGDTAVVPVQVTSGPVFGAGYDPNDVLRENWGTLTFIFTTCNAGTMTYDSTMGFGMGTANISRLTSVAGLSCP